MIGIHLLREKARKPCIRRYLLIDEGNGLITGDLHSWLTLLASAEPGFRPTPVTIGIEINGSHTFDIIALDINLKASQRISYKTVGCSLLRNFFF